MHAYYLQQNSNIPLGIGNFPIFQWHIKIDSESKMHDNMITGTYMYMLTRFLTINSSKSFNTIQ